VTTVYICFGYRCSCGERVTVLRLRSGEANRLPPRKVVVCRNGHTAVYTSSELAALDCWTEQIEGEAA
jgi:hypothetical protein